MQSEDGLTFYRKGVDDKVSATSPSPDQADQDATGVPKVKVRKRKVKLSVGGIVKVGKSFYREHLNKEAKLSEVRSFLEKAEAKCCQHITSLCRQGMLL